MRVSHVSTCPPSFGAKWQSTARVRHVQYPLSQLEIRISRRIYTSNETLLDYWITKQILFLKKIKWTSYSETRALTPENPNNQITLFTY